MSDLYLAHHGIKGQKWGVRRWQNDDGSLTDAGRKHYGYGDGRRNSSIKVVSKSNKKSSGYSDEETKEEKKKFKLTDKQKRNIAIGIGVAGACLAAYGFYRYMNPRDLSNIDLSNNPNFDKETGLLKKVSEVSSLEDATAVNPKEDLTNCSKCSAAYELRRRGYDVVAGKHADENSFVQKASGVSKYFNYKDTKMISPKPEIDTTFDRTVKEFEDFKKIYGEDSVKTRHVGFGLHQIDFRNINDSQNNIHENFRKTCPIAYSSMGHYSAQQVQWACEKYGPNARGNIYIPYKTDGHMISFENDDKGKTTFIDPQLYAKNPETYKFKSLVYNIEHNYPDFDAFDSMVVRRTDNAEPNFEYLKQNHVVENNIPDNMVDKIATGSRYASAALAGVGLSAAATYQENINKNKKKQKKEHK